MRIRYLDWRRSWQASSERMRLLKNLFAQLLIREDGDVERALEILRRAGERYGLFDEDLTFEDFKKALLSERFITAGERGMSLTPRGERFLRVASLESVFGGLRKGEAGEHHTPRSGEGGEYLAETHPYAFGDDLAAIDFRRSFQNSFLRAGGEGLGLREEDLEVQAREHFTSTATVLLLDISHSMVLYGEDRITPAKRVALALTELILTRYPHDALHVALFGDDAREIPVKELPYAGVGPFHTNTRAGLRLARRILSRKKQANRQIFLITDGKPTVLTEQGEVYRNSFGLDRRIVNKTLDEGAECRRHGITITTFMLAEDPMLKRFVEDLTRVNRGRALFSSVDHLEHAVMVDFLRNRRRNVR